MNGGRLTARGGLRMSTTDSAKPRALRLRRGASFSSDTESPTGVQIWCGVWELEGGGLSVRIGDLEMHGNKFAHEVSGKTGEAVGSGVSVLRLTGNGVSTIHARNLNFVDAAQLDVRRLNVTPGTYRVFDGLRIVGTDLELAPGTDVRAWDLLFDRENGDVLLRRKP